MQNSPTSFLHPHGPAKSFKFTQANDDILVMSCHDILTLVNPSTTTGRDYILSELEMEVATTALSKRNLSI